MALLFDLLLVLQSSRDDDLVALNDGATTEVACIKTVASHFREKEQNQQDVERERDFGSVKKIVGRCNNMRTYDCLT